MPELTTAQWVLIAALGIAQFGLLIAGLVAVLRAPAQRLTAPRVVWAAICFVQFIESLEMQPLREQPIATLRLVEYQHFWGSNTIACNT